MIGGSHFREANNKEPKRVYVVVLDGILKALLEYIIISMFLQPNYISFCNLIVSIFFLSPQGFCLWILLPLE